MMKEKINVYSNTLELCKKFTEFLQTSLEVYPHINLSLSGGSTPKVLFDYWASICKESIDWSRISFFWGDERCVPPTDDMSNYGMTKKHLFDFVPTIKPSAIFRVHGENNSSDEAKAYGEVIRENTLSRDGVPCFEIIMLGLGDDGHTVSIFPNNIELWDSSENCIVAKHPDSGMERVSFSGKVVNNAQHIVFLVTGKNKAEKVRDIINNRENLLDTYPAARVKPVCGQLHWFLDSDAASLL